jgi:hypothetical protein
MYLSYDLVDDKMICLDASITLAPMALVARSYYHELHTMVDNFYFDFLTGIGSRM